MALSNRILQRNRLIKLAGNGSDGRIVYIQAPAGYGKTVFAGQWMDSEKGPNAMAALDAYDNTEGDICNKLKNVLGNLCTEEDEKVSAYINHPDFSKAPVEFLMRAAKAMPRDSRGRLVIDDLHYVPEPFLQRILADFLLRLPSGILICILSREALPNTFSELVLKNGVTFICNEQLLFDSQEIYSLYKSRNLSITKKQAEDVLSYTEGWPIGINALLLLEQIPTETLPEDWLESFWDMQVWKTWDESERRFMIDTCMDDELTEGLCDALTGNTGSGVMLEQLAAKGAFLSGQSDGIYRFHKLFQNFLKKKFQSEPEEYRTEKIRASGRWHFKQNDFYHALEKFSYVKDYEQMACCFDLLEEMDRCGFDTERVMHAVRSALDKEMLDRYPYLYFMMAFTARNEGRIEEFTKYADQYYKNYPRIVERNPELSHNIFFLYVMDYRFTLEDIAKTAARARGSSEFKGVRGSATQYFPLYHRAYRDFSELLPGDIDSNVAAMEKILGSLLGEECPMLTACISGGLYYEKGELQRAQEQALLAVSALRKEFAPESKFCALSLLLAVTHALWQPEQEKLFQKDIQKMIEEDGAFYLQYNFEAFICRNRLDEGETEAAKEWLETRGTDVYEHLDFFRLYGHFTTARAYIALNDYNHAVILLEKILEMCTVLKRRTDIIEAKILLAVSFWNKMRRNREKALGCLAEAIMEAQPLGYEQLFFNDGAKIKNILSELRHWTMRSDYDGPLTDEFVRRLYIGAAEQADRGIGAAGNKKSEMGVKLTPRQKTVAELMCRGYSYRKIAEELGIQFSTVRSHIELIYRKLDVSTMDEAIKKMRRLHITEEP